MKSVILANTMYATHLALLAFILIAPFVLSRSKLPYHIILCILVMLDWNDIDGMCFLTKLEDYFRTGKWSHVSALEGGPEVFRPLVNQLFGWNLNRIEADRANYVFVLSCLLISFVRYSRLSSF